ncbi:MAG: DUF4350 domain-containing protein [Verrucomicrobia bacterium]|nr:DUF4350 domain-containing protein [Verrucomicrobiota bacterium]
MTVALRPREPWEAVDLGCSLVRRDYGQLMALWATTVLPVWLVIIAVMHNAPTWFSLVIWWLKPLYDRVPLFFISKATFGVRPGFRETWKAWPRLWSRDLFSALVLRRLSLIRSLALPVIILEGQKGKAMRTRIAALASDGGGAGASATWVFVKLEIAVMLGIMALTADFIPKSVSPNWTELFTFQDASDFVIQPAYYWWINICYLFAVTLVEPFYVGAGFGLYLNCRTRLEGWDVELAFRRLAARLRSLVASTVAVLIFLLPLCTMAENAGQVPPIKETSIPSKASRKDAEETKAANKAAAEILKQPEFKVHTRTKKEWVSDKSKSNLDFNVFQILSYIIFWLAVAALVAFLVIYIMRNRHLLGLPQLRPKTVKQFKGPRVVMGLDIDRASLPADIVASARQHWLAGETREALSLLYRGALSQLVELHRLPIRDSDTEDDCHDHVRRVGEHQMTGYFSKLTNAWINVAYAGIRSCDRDFDQLCADWPFQPTGSPPRPILAAPMIALFFVLPFITSCNGHWEEMEKTLGYKGKARINPFLAAEMLLQENGHSTERSPTLGKLPDAEDGIIFTSSEAGIPEGRARQLLSWVHQGGHLVYSFAGSLPYNDWSAGAEFFSSVGNDDKHDPILTKLGVELNYDHAKIDPKDKKLEKINKKEDESHIGLAVVKKNLKWNGKTYAVEVSDRPTFNSGHPLRGGEWATAGEKEHAILSLPYGAGRVTLLNHAAPLRNRYLGSNDHAAWLVALAGENQRAIKDVRFVVAMNGSFWSLLWRRGWMPLVGLVFIIVVWLWKNGRRFGPVMPVELSETRHFTDHVSALGKFFFRLRRGDLLLTSAADAVRSRFRQKFPQVACGGGDAVISLLASQSGLSKERVQTALAAHAPGQNHQLVRLLHDLQTLRQSLS